MMEADAETAGKTPRALPTRLYAQVAAAAPVAVVFVRTNGWWVLLRWDLTSFALEPGAWFRGRLYPRRSDLSPDGTRLVYFAMKGGRPYHAVAKVPWLFALELRADDSTWTRGRHFVGPGTLASTEVVQYAAERRRGWVEHASCPPRDPDDTWDERRRCVLTKTDATTGVELIARDAGTYAPTTPFRIEGRGLSYTVVPPRGPELPLPELVWADWDGRGQLLVATRAGELQVLRWRQGELTTLHTFDCASLRPDPRPAPAWARDPR